MKENAWIPDDIPFYLGGFNKKLYPHCFAEYKRLFGDGLQKAAESPAAAAEQIVDVLDGRVTGLFRQRKMLENELLLLQYTVPAALDMGLTELAEAIQAEWNRRHPNLKFGMGTYEDFYSGFQNTFFGIPVGKRSDEE